MSTTILLSKIEKIPKEKIEEVSDFIDFIIQKSESNNKKPKPVFGSGKGMFIIPDDFDAPLDDLKEYM